MVASRMVEGAIRTIRHLDLTSLGNRDAAERKSVRELLTLGLCQSVKPAAFCTWPEFMPFVVSSYRGSGHIQPCTVINFPGGNGPIDLIKKETSGAELDGVKEVDIVADYQSFLAGNVSLTRDKLRACRDQVPEGVLLKVILESSAILPDRKMLFDLSALAIECGADYLKTSTGKHPSGGATPQAIAIMLQAIKEHAGDRVIGIKASGGIRTVEQAMCYFDVVDGELKGPRVALGQTVSPRLFRIGASQPLLADALGIINGPSSEVLAAVKQAATASY
jgi:deoxyribose-phosphate aldolase